LCIDLKIFTKVERIGWRHKIVILEKLLNFF
jgi:hypothetical protein